MSNLFTLIVDNFVLAYLIVINVLSGVVFSFDKFAAVQNYRRVPEITLHLFEFLGGVFINLILIYLIKHKNKKVSYLIYTWLLCILWIVVLILNYKNN